MVLFWQIAAFADGRYLTQTPRLISSTPAYVQFAYVPRRASVDLPSSIAYPDAGKLSHRLVDGSMTPLGNWTIVDTSGAFDTPEYSGTGTLPAGCSTDASGAVACIEDFGIRCLIDKTAYPDCPSGFVDMVTRIRDLAANGGILDYSRKLTPVYDETPDPSRPGEYLQVPRVAVSINSRSISRGKTFFFIAPGGGSLYTETGVKGWALRNQTDRYRVTETGQNTLAGQAVTTEASPNEAFVKTAPATSPCNSYRPDKIIDPFSTNDIYDWRHDTVNGMAPDRYVSVANLVCE